MLAIYTTLINTGRYVSFTERARFTAECTRTSLKMWCFVAMGTAKPDWYDSADGVVSLQKILEL